MTNPARVHTLAKRDAYTLASLKSKSALLAVAAGFLAPGTGNARSVFAGGSVGLAVVGFIVAGGTTGVPNGLFFFIGGSLGRLGGGGGVSF